MKTTAIAILNYNGAGFLKQFLPSVIKHSKCEGVSVFIIDNGSTDDSLLFLEKNYPQVNLVKLDRNYGFAEGYNRGLSEINADYYLLLNSDVEVTGGWLEPLIDVMDHKPEVACCMPKIKWFAKKDHFEYAGASGGFVDKYGYPFCRGRIFGTVEKDEGQYDSMIPVLWTTGACMIIRAELFFKAGGFDNDFFAHMEEIDLCWRLKNMGYQNICNPQSVVYHVGGGTLPQQNPFKTFLNYRNNLYLIFKNNEKKKATRLVIIRFFYDFLAQIRFLLLLEFRNALSVSKAHVAFIKNLKSTKKKRQAFASLIKKTNHPEIMKKDLIYQYFVKRKTKFSDHFNW